MTGKLFSTILGILVFLNAIAIAAGGLFTDLASSYPGLGKYAAISLAVSALIAPWLPRIQKLGGAVREAKNK